MNIERRQYGHTDARGLAQSAMLTKREIRQDGWKLQKWENTEVLYLGEIPWQLDRGELAVHPVGEEARHFETKQAK